MTYLEGVLVAQKEDFCNMLLTILQLIDSKDVTVEELIKLEETLEMLSENPIAVKFMTEEPQFMHMSEECCAKIVEAKKRFFSSLKDQ